MTKPLKGHLQAVNVNNKGKHAVLFGSVSETLAYID